MNPPEFRLPPAVAAVMVVAAASSPLAPAQGVPDPSAIKPPEAEYSPYLFGCWRDPAFDASERASYYVRVLEIPTPRWTTHDARFFGVKVPEGVPASIQERAYTSPLWYTPAK